MPGLPEQARRLLERPRAAAAAQQRTGSPIELVALRARALAACGDQPGALAALAEAITLARPEGYLPVFAGEGPALAAVLDQLIATRRRGPRRRPSSRGSTRTSSGRPSGRAMPAQPGPHPADPGK